MTGLWPAEMANASASTLAKRAEIARETLNARSRPGLFFYPTLAFGYLPLVINNRIDVIVTTAVAVSLLVLALVRRSYFRAAPLEDVERWRRRFAGFACANIALFDGFVAYELWHREIDARAVVLLVGSVGLRASSTYAASLDLRMHDVFATWTRIPMFVALLVLATSASVALLGLLLLHAAYIHIHSRQLNLEFWRGIAATENLAIAHEKLQHEVAMRERTEIELRLAQKLESVGRLATGIAHEINSPLQAMKGNLAFVAEGVDELLAIARAYQRVAAGPVDLSHAEDLDYLSENLPSSIDLTDASLDRAATIVRSIKTFASSDDAQTRAPYDINDALECTLAISRREYAAIADIETQLGHLPLVDCYPSELNQALLHLVVNAAQAIADTDGRGVIRVTTFVESGAVHIEISDTGPGIPHAIRDRIFDPFFTTKSEGTGQGLAIARSVVARHGGELTFDSELGHGTTFVIRLPIALAA